MRQFWGQQQRFFKEMANASKVEFVVAQAKEALAGGMSVVIGLQSTGESGMDKVQWVDYAVPVVFAVGVS